MNLIGKAGKPQIPGAISFFLYKRRYFAIFSLPKPDTSAKLKVFSDVFCTLGVKIMKVYRLKAAIAALFIVNLALPYQSAEAQSSFAGGLAGGIVGGMIAGSIAANAYRQQHSYYGRPRYVRRGHTQVSHTRGNTPAERDGTATIKASADPFATGKPQAADSPIPVSAKP